MKSCCFFSPGPSTLATFWAFVIFFVGGSTADDDKIPLIFDGDANYDDTLALMYLVSNPLFDIRAVTIAGAGFATHHGGPINQQQVLQLLGAGEIPVSYGAPVSLSPISTFPIQWRVEIDEFFQSQNLPDSDTPLSVYPSDILIANILKESTTAVTVAVSGPATNLALALQREPELASRISGLFLMGSNYGGGPNNVYDWQMTFNGVSGSCVEDASAADFTPNQKPLVDPNNMTLTAAIRPGCRGNDMSTTGNTEWNVFLDALAWHTVTRIVATASHPPPIYVIASGATEDMPITMEDFEEGVVGLDEQLASFIMNLAAAFLNGGEAKWWDTLLVVGMANVITGLPIEESICTAWTHSTGFKVELAWRSVNESEAAAGILNPYGSITDKPGIGPNAIFCTQGNVTNMQDQFWSTVGGENDGGTIADPDVYLRKLSSDGDETTSSSAYSASLTTMTVVMTVVGAVSSSTLYFI